MRERPKFGHNPAREQNEVWAQFCKRSMKTWAQICKHKHFYIGCLKTQQQLRFVNGKNKLKNKIIFFFFFHNLGRALVNLAGRKPVWAGRSALRNMPSWNTSTATQSIAYMLQTDNTNHSSQDSAEWGLEYTAATRVNIGVSKHATSTTSHVKLV